VGDRRRSLLFPTGLLLGLLLAASGCSRATRDRWLAVLFDDPPRATAAAAPGSVAAAPSPEPGSSEPAGAIRPSSTAALVSVHPPYGTRECGVCHALSDSRSFTGTVPGTGMRAADDSQRVRRQATRLVLPPRELCFTCHVQMTEAALAAEGRAVHAPVLHGDCVVCHDPHRSRRSHLLRAAPVSALCFKCHNRGAVATSAAHAALGSRGDCTACHDPHDGTTSLFLREDGPAGGGT